MKKKGVLKKVTALSMALGICLSSSIYKANQSNEWNMDATYPVNTWKEIDGKQYYFGSDGYMLHDTVTPDGYTVGSDGAWID